MNRRTFLCGVTLGALSTSVVAEAQPTKTARIGLLEANESRGIS